MACLLGLIFFSLAVLGRIVVQFALTGNHGVRFAKRNAPLGEVLPGLVFVLSFATSLIVMLLVRLEWMTATYFENIWLNIAALGLGLVGIVIMLIAQWQMGKHWRIGVDQLEATRLVTDGLFNYSRNPIYFGIFLYWLAVCITLPLPVIWMCASFCWISIEIIVRHIEEPYLERLHGDDYRAYVARTHRYILWRTVNYKAICQQ